MPGRAADGTVPLLLRDPTISRTQIAFAYGGDIWTVARAGGAAHRLVTGYALDTGPIFSPDGSLVAFSGEYDGNIDVYVVPATGGEPRRLTYHPGPDYAVGWTPDGKRILFRSRRASPTDPNKLFTVSVDGGFPAELPLDMAETGSYSADGMHLAYVPNFRWEPFWQGYRGGQTTPVRIADLADSRILTIPRTNSNDDVPMWIGSRVYFLSDRDGPVTLFSYDTRSRTVTRELPSRGFDITSASAGDGAIVYAKFDELHVYDPVTRADRRIVVSLAADMPQVRPHWEYVGAADDGKTNSGDRAQIENAAISPTGQRAVFEVHGTILTVPAEHGDIRDISGAPDTANRDPAWSPDGNSIAFFSDRSGEYALVVRDQRGLQKPRMIDLGTPPSFFYSPVWSPDSKKIAYTDKRLNLWLIDLDHPVPLKVASALYGGFGPSDFEPSWSPDSRWLTYANELPSFLHAIYVYSVEERRSRRITDGLSDSRFPVFDAAGKYLYFISSTNTGLTSSGLDMTSDQHPVSSNVYAAVLDRNAPSPVVPQSDDEAAPKASPGPKPDAAKHAAVTIDFDGLAQRIVALPVANANYIGLFAGKPGELYLVAQPLTSVSPDPALSTVAKFDLTSRMTKPLATGLTAFALAANGEKALFAQGDKWMIAATDKPLDASAKPLATDELRVFVDPPAQWRQMYHETWRIERDFFYDPHYHGLDLGAAERRFEPYLAGIASRDDLTFLFEEMLSYLSVGHMFVRGGTQSAVPLPTVNVGLLGADYRIENGRYRFAKIYDGENWNPNVQAPLTQPGANVHTGDYLVAVNGHEVRGEDNVYRFFENTAGKQTAISVATKADGSDARGVTVIPVQSEARLRNLDWIEHNRREVDRLSGGKLAYVYLPDTGYGGFTNFNRYFFAQVGKQGVILDERYNHGGQIADYVIDYLKRTPMSILAPRDGRLIVDPPLAIYGPKVMIVNEFAGSGGDALPWYFRKAHLGPLVGVRTWGGLVGIGGYPTLIDGGTVTAPRIAIGGLHGAWEVEGVGIPPDIEVVQDPHAVREGHDPQLEAAVAKALQLLRDHPIPTYERPPYPDHHPVLPPPGS